MSLDDAQHKSSKKRKHSLGKSHFFPPFAFCMSKSYTRGMFFFQYRSFPFIFIRGPVLQAQAFFFFWSAFFVFSLGDLTPHFIDGLCNPPLSILFWELLFPLHPRLNPPISLPPQDSLFHFFPQFSLPVPPLHTKCTTFPA